MTVFYIVWVLLNICVLINAIMNLHLQKRLNRMDAELYQKNHEIEVLQKNFEWLLKDYEAYTHRPIRWWE